MQDLTIIEKGMVHVNQVNKTLTSLVTNMSELKAKTSLVTHISEFKTKVCDIESLFTRLNIRCDKNEPEVSQIKRDHIYLEKDINKMRKS